MKNLKVPCVAIAICIRVQIHAVWIPKSKIFKVLKFEAKTDRSEVFHRLYSYNADDVIEMRTCNAKAVLVSAIL